MTNNMKAAYTKQKNAAKVRGVEWRFDFDEWLSVWEKSGHISERGKGIGKYVMARRGDVGPYSSDNVEIILHEQNSFDARRNHQRSQYDLRSKQIGTGRGWTRVGRKFQVTVSKKYIGAFETQEEAESAYKAAASLVLASSSKRVAGINPALPEDSRK